MRAEEWSLVGVWCVLTLVGAWITLRAPKATTFKRTGRLMALSGVGLLCNLLPRLVSWPYAARMMLSTAAIALFGCVVVMTGLDLFAHWRKVGSTSGSAVNTAAESSNRGDDR
jgi:hypothetical protein